MNDNFLTCQIAAIVEYALTHRTEVDLPHFLNALQKAVSTVEGEMAWRKIHGHPDTEGMFG